MTRAALASGRRRAGPGRDCALKDRFPTTHLVQVLLVQRDCLREAKSCQRRQSPADLFVEASDLGGVATVARLLIFLVRALNPNRGEQKPRGLLHGGGWVCTNVGRIGSD